MKLEDVKTESNCRASPVDLDAPLMLSQAEVPISEGIMSADEVLLRLSAQARGSLEVFLTETGGALFPDLTTERAQAHLFLLKKAKFKRRSSGGATNPVVETEVELELHDPQAALRDLGRHHKLFTERSESVAVGVLKVEVEYVER